MSFLVFSVECLLVIR